MQFKELSAVDRVPLELTPKPTLDSLEAVAKEVFGMAAQTSPETQNKADM